LGVKKLREKRNDIVLLDLSLDASNGLETFLKIKEINPDIPIIILTSNDDIEIAKNSIEEGAQDYLLKDEFNLRHLTRSITYALERKKTEQKLHKANKELNTFVYRASHDIRGPICTMMGLVVLAQKDEAETFRKSYLKLIETSLAKLDETLINLLDVVKIKERTVKIELLNLQEIIDELISVIPEKQSSAKVIYKIKIDPLMFIYTDKYLINLVLYNIIDNAITYKKDSHPCIIKINSFIKDSNFYLRIIDNGEGMSDITKEYIYDMFYRGNIKSKGSGLGLYIVKNIIDIFEGEISVKSNKMGSTFTISLPQISTPKLDKIKRNDIFDSNSSIYKRLINKKDYN
jgi:K+-sensing histidine kinase KdpD